MLVDKPEPGHRALPIPTRRQQSAKPLVMRQLEMAGARERPQQLEFFVVAAVVAIQSQQARETFRVRPGAQQPLGGSEMIVEPAALQQQVGQNLLRPAVVRSNSENRLGRLEGAWDVAQLEAQDKGLHQHLRPQIRRLAHRQQYARGLLVAPIAHQHHRVLVLTRYQKKPHGQNEDREEPHHHMVSCLALPYCLHGPISIVVGLASSTGTANARRPLSSAAADPDQSEALSRLAIT